MAADRLLPTSASTPPVTGAAYADAVAEEVAALWNRAPCRLTSVAGTNTITAVTDPPIAAYATGMHFLLRPAVTNTGATTLNVDAKGAKTVKTAAGVALAGGELVAGRDYLVWYDGTDIRILTETAGSAAATKRAIFSFSKASGTAGGTVSALTWTKYPLDTTAILNEITGASIASSVMSLPAGTYVVRASCLFYRCNEVRLRLRNTTDGATVAGIAGTNARAGDAGNAGDKATLMGKFTLAATKNIELQFYSSSAQPTDGLGRAASSGETELYGYIELEKVA